MALLRRPIRGRRTSVVTLMLAALIGTLLFVVPRARPASADASAGGGDYVSLTEPTRVLDTRNRIGVTTTTLVGAARPVDENCRGPRRLDLRRTSLRGRPTIRSSV